MNAEESRLKIQEKAAVGVSSKNYILLNLLGLSYHSNPIL